jgi:hypothetical protein
MAIHINMAIRLSLSGYPHKQLRKKSENKKIRIYKKSETSENKINIRNKKSFS